MLAIAQADYVIRRAVAHEGEAIRSLVRSERLNPHHLYFENFAVAVRDGELIGASQIRRHKDGSRELGSVVVARPWRGRGISAEIIGTLLEAEGGAVYAITRRKHADHYARWGFASVAPRTAPRAIRFNYRIGSTIGWVMAKLQRRPVNRLIILRRPSSQLPALATPALMLRDNRITGRMPASMMRRAASEASSTAARDARS
jgi:amino-acid N-acetyltransferase